MTLRPWSRPGWRVASALPAILLIGALLPSSVAAAAGPAFATQPGSAVYNQPFGPEAVAELA